MKINLIYHRLSQFALQSQIQFHSKLYHPKQPPLLTLKLFQNMDYPHHFMLVK